uniref:Retrotransposon Copia-like N-terminal domain-containing protein n=1 Tax=Cajanus cajan TaxID=3821 RepID=A0A151REU9_CAJCA|nr:hypothetical protein KK1_037703 [Cajanus cajan]
MDDNNPLFIGSSNNSGHVLVSHPLVGDNSNSWKKAMRMALLGKNKFGFVDGSIVEPTSGHAHYSLWHHNDNIVASCILNALSKEMQTSVLHCSSTKAIWVDLNERFEQCNGPLIFQMKRELVSLKQDSMFVSSYYARLHLIRESLMELKPTHKCTCNGIQPWFDYDQMEYVKHFLMGLNKAYSSIRGQILSMDPFPPITQIFSHVYFQLGSGVIVLLLPLI